MTNNDAVPHHGRYLTDAPNDAAIEFIRLKVFLGFGDDGDTDQ